MMKAGIHCNQNAIKPTRVLSGELWYYVTILFILLGFAEKHECAINVATVKAALGGIDLLVISRKVDQSLRIGEHIEVKIVGIGKGKVRIGISAPSDVPVYREELYQTLVKGNRKSLFTSKEMVEAMKHMFSPPPSSS